MSSSSRTRGVTTDLPPGDMGADAPGEQGTLSGVGKGDKKGNPGA